MTHISEGKCAVWPKWANWMLRIQYTQNTIGTSINALNLSRNKSHIGINWPFICLFAYWQGCILATKEYRSGQVMLHFIGFDRHFISKCFTKFSGSCRISDWTLRTYLVSSAAVCSVTIMEESMGKYTLPVSCSHFGIFNDIGSGRRILSRMGD